MKYCQAERTAVSRFYGINSHDPYLKRTNFYTFFALASIHITVPSGLINSFMAHATEVRAKKTAITLLKIFYRNI
jgi:hypothetical protein